ncbi:TPA: hypothetical protein RUT62_000889 [Escherichia coli]|uniref:hypothetical protein n=1 Tax=Escherichia coli TaxID=562 RepID=UPI000D0A7DAA|nr:hypothetical protein [Escherichia coli]MBB6821956.1 hypothetical protein [Escherichia coli]MCO0410606.1 hypothetical protein [Escherichia coli]UMW12583.1 hypothetical protein L6L56_13560 [Escherichia coli]HAL6144580.1 hypothetical protein [Escherichia coli]HBA4872063.1 hypothetical protein [Escherichia coli]
MKGLVKVALVTGLIGLAFNVNANEAYCDKLYEDYERAYTMANSDFFAMDRVTSHWEHFILYGDARDAKSDTKVVKNYAKNFAFVMSIKDHKENDIKYKQLVTGLAIMAAERVVKDFDASAYNADDGVAFDRVRIDFKNMCMKNPGEMENKMMHKYNQYFL